MDDLIVLHHGAIGDFLLALSVIQSVRRHLGVGRVTAIATAASARLAAGRSAVDDWRSPEAVGLHSLFRDDGDLDQRLIGLLHPAMRVLSFLSGPMEAMHARLSRGRVGAGTGPAALPSATHHPPRVVSVDPRPSGLPRHITGQWTEAVRAQGWSVSDPDPAILRMERRASNGHDRRSRVLIHPGAGGLDKCWPVERFMELADALAAHAVHWMLGPTELEIEPARFDGLRRRAAGRNEPVWIADRLEPAAERIAEADLYIGNDAGMTHLAAAVGVRTVALFGPTDPRIWRPLGEHVTVVAPPRPGPIADVQVEEVRKALVAP